MGSIELGLQVRGGNGLGRWGGGHEDTGLGEAPAPGEETTRGDAKFLRHDLGGLAAGEPVLHGLKLERGVILTAGFGRDLFQGLHDASEARFSLHIFDTTSIKAGAYERSLSAGKSHNFASALPEHLAEQAEEALKSSYNLEFLGVGRAVKERELEDRLADRLRDFILELGYGFCFVGRQHRLTLGTKEYFIDLLF